MHKSPRAGASAAVIKMLKPRPGRCSGAVAQTARPGGIIGPGEDGQPCHDHTSSVLTRIKRTWKKMVATVGHRMEEAWLQQ